MKLKISRKTNLILNFLINECVPPFIRDCKYFICPAFKILFGDKAHLFFNFHDKVYDLSDEEFVKLNKDIQDVVIQRKTDLNQPCVDRILEDIEGDILEVGCGNGYLSELISEKGHQTTAVDIALNDNLQADSKVKYIESSSESLPFEDNSFDTVVCTHTLEHVRDIQKTLSELRRVAKNNLIIVVPCERPYKYTFNLHIHFFPYEYNFYSVVGKSENQNLQKLSGDWYYLEEI